MLYFQNELPTSNRNAIIDKINSVSAYLGIPASWLEGVMYFESKLNPKAVNPYTNATGLIQFMPSTAKSLGTSVEQLFNMPFLTQLDYVKAYYAPYRGKIKSIDDLYLATFYPYAMGKPDSYVLGSQSGATNVANIAKQNPVFDPTKTGKVTKGAVKKYFLAKLPVDFVKRIIKHPVSLTYFAVGVCTVIYFLTKKHLD